MRKALLLFVVLAILGFTGASEETLGENTGGCSGTTEVATTEEPAETTVRFGVALCLFLLGVAYFNGYLLERYHFHYLHEAGAALLLGILVGLIIKLAGPSQEIHDIVSFDENFFFLFLLPPIIFEAGYNMKRRNFFRNIFPVCMLAFLGTFISTAAIGLMTYAVGIAGWAHAMSFLECLIFGALISATDPVTVLAIFQAMHADVNLYAMVFGESVLNDAVAIVLYRTLNTFNPENTCPPAELLGPNGGIYQTVDITGCNFTTSSTLGDMIACKEDLTCQCETLEPITFNASISSINIPGCPSRDGLTGTSILNAVATFFIIFGGSLLIGTVVAVISAIIFKFTKLREHEFEFIEMALLVVFPYFSWMVAEGFALSGIVAILFCGIVMAHYTYNNLSERTQDFSRKFFKIIASLSELFVFIYLGFAMFSFNQFWDCMHGAGQLGEYISLIFLSILIVLFARTFNVFPNALIVNLVKRQPIINKKYQLVLWASGLRGAIAFALAVEAAKDYKENGVVILSLTLFIVLFTVLAIGGSVFTLLNKLQVTEKAKTEEKDSYEGVVPGGLMHRGEGKATAPKKSRWIDFDRRFIKPFLTRTTKKATENVPVVDEEEESRDRAGLLSDEVNEEGVELQKV